MKPPLEKLHAEHSIYEVVRGHPGFEDFNIETIIKTGPKRTTAIAQLSGAKVVIKHYLHSEARNQVLRAQKELDALSKRMCAAPYRINECVAAFPELGIIALSFVPGLRLDDAIRRADLKQRSALIELSGGWLRAYTEFRTEVSPSFSPGWWIRKRSETDISMLSATDQELFNLVLKSLRERAPSLRGSSVMKAAVHGDYVSINAHYHEGTLYGVDVQGEAWRPIVDDVAKFLVWTQTQTPLEPSVATVEMVYRAGVAEPDFTAFLASGVLPEGEIPSLLPFFIGLQMLERIVTYQRDPLALSRLHQMATRFLAEGRHGM